MISTLPNVSFVNVNDVYFSVLDSTKTLRRSGGIEYLGDDTEHVRNVEIFIRNVCIIVENDVYGAMKSYERYRNDNSIRQCEKREIFWRYNAM